MDKLITWLRTQLDTDEAHARKDLWAAEHATPGRWTARYGHNLPVSHVETESGPVAKLDSGRHDADALLIARFRPDNVRERAERVLRQIQAHRAILDDYDRALDRRRQHPDDVASAADLLSLVRTVKRLASIYSDRDGYAPDARERIAALPDASIIAPLD